MAVTLVILADRVLAQQPYKVRAGDQLRIEVLEDSSLNRTVLVLPDGTIAFPFAGQFRARGRSVLTIQAALTKRLAPNFASGPTVFVSAGKLAVVPKAEVRTTEASFEIYAMGELSKPGRIAVAGSSGVTLLQAIAEAGGFTRFAATKRIQLRRPAEGGEQVYIFDYRTGGGISGATLLQPGDVIVVPERRLFE